MTASVTDQLGSAVADLASREPRLCFAYVFGSTIRGTANPASDADVAVYLTEQLDLLEEAGLEQTLSQRVDRPVDLLVLKRFLDFKPLHDEYLRMVRQRARAGRLSRG